VSTTAHAKLILFPLMTWQAPLHPSFTCRMSQLQACSLFSSLQLPLVMHRYPSGVIVVQSSTRNEQAQLDNTLKFVEEAGALGAMELSQLAKISIVLAKEQLLGAETAGVLCRDTTVEGLRFFPNQFTQWDVMQ